MAENIPVSAPSKEDDPIDLGIGNGSRNFDDQAYRKTSTLDVNSSDDSSCDDGWLDCYGKCDPSSTISCSRKWNSGSRLGRCHDCGYKYRMNTRRLHNHKHSNKPEAPEKKQHRNEETQEERTRKRNRNQEYLEQSDGFISDSGLQNRAASGRKVYSSLTTPRRNIAAKRSIQQRELSKHDVMLSLTLSAATASKLSQLLNPKSDNRPATLDASNSSLTLKLGASLNPKQTNQWQGGPQMNFVGNLELKLLSHPGINARRPREDYDEVEELVTAMKRSKLDTPPPETVQCEKDATVEASITRRKLDAFGKFIKRELHGQTSSSRTLRRQHNISKVSYCKLCGVSHRSNWICPHRNRFRIFCMACGQTGHVESICHRKRPGLGMVYAFDDHAMQRINNLWLQDKRLLGQMFQVKKSVTSTIVELDENDKLSCDESVEGIGDTGNSERTLLASSRLDEILRSKLEQSDTIDSGAVINLLSDDENVCETDIADIVPDNLITKDSERMELESLHPDAIPRHKSAQSGTTEIVDLSCDEYVDITDNVIADTVPDNQKDSEHMLLTSWRPGVITRDKSAQLVTIEPDELVELDSDEFVVEVNDSDDDFEFNAETKCITPKKSTDSPLTSPPRAMFSTLIISTPPSELLQPSEPAAVYTNYVNAPSLPESRAQTPLCNPFLTPPNENVLDRSPSKPNEPCQRQPSPPQCPLADTSL